MYSSSELLSICWIRCCLIQESSNEDSKSFKIDSVEFCFSTQQKTNTEGLGPRAHQCVKVGKFKRAQQGRPKGMANDQGANRCSQKLGEKNRAFKKKEGTWGRLGLPECDPGVLRTGGRGDVLGVCDLVKHLCRGGSFSKTCCSV